MSQTVSIVRELRAAAGLTQQQVATKSGVSNGQVALLELGKRNLTPDVAQRLAPVFKTSADTMLRAEKALLAVKAVSELSNLTDEQVKDLMRVDGGSDQVLKALSAGIDVLARATPAALKSDGFKALYREVDRLMSVAKSAIDDQAQDLPATYTDATGKRFSRDARGLAREVPRAVKYQDDAGGNEIYHDAAGQAFYRDSSGRARRLQQHRD